jgi:hypothetical protein
MRKNSGNTEASSCRCEPCPVRPARRTGSDNLATGRKVEGWKEGTATGLAMRRCASEWAVRSKPRKLECSGCRQPRPGWRQQRRPSPDGTGWRRTRRGLGGRHARRRWPRNLGDPPARLRAGGRRPGRPKPGPNAWWESEGPIGAMTRGERVTPDPAEQRGSARVGTNFRREA